MWKTTLSAHVNPSLTFAEGKHGVGGIASADIPSGSTLMSLPYSSILSEAYSASTRRGRYIQALLGKKRPIECTGRALLYLEMVYQRFGCGSSSNSSSISSSSRNTVGTGSNDDDDDTKFREYLQSLPAEYDDPAWWDEDEVKTLLFGTNLMEGAMLRRAWLKRIYTALVPELIHEHPEMFSKSVYTYENFLWAHSAFSSRGFPDILSHRPGDEMVNIKKNEASINSSSSPSLPPPSSSVVSPLPLLGCEGATGVNPFQDPPHEPVGCMLPVLDLLNHVPRTPIAWIRSSTGVSFIHEGKEILKKGEEVNNNYGPKSNEELLMGFGFTLPNNADDTYTLAIKPLAAPQQMHQHVHQSTPSISASNLATTNTLAAEYDDAFATATIFQKIELPTRYVLRMRLVQGTNKKMNLKVAKKRAKNETAKSAKKTKKPTMIFDKDQVSGVIPNELYQLARLDSLCSKQKEAIYRESKEYLCEVLSRPISLPVEERALDFLESLLRSKEQGLVRAHSWLKEEEEEEDDNKLDGEEEEKKKKKNVNNNMGMTRKYKHRRYLARSYIRGQYRLLVNSLVEIEHKREEIDLGTAKFLLPLLRQQDESDVQELPICVASCHVNEESKETKYTIPLSLSESIELITCDECKQEMEQLEEVEEDEKEEVEEMEEAPRKKQRS
jgi:hypothetical protein